MEIKTEHQRHQIVEALKEAQPPIVVQQQNSDGMVVIYGSANSDLETTWHIDAKGRVNTVGTR
jgi:hypothetical protein